MLPDRPSSAWPSIRHVARASVPILLTLAFASWSDYCAEAKRPQKALTSLHSTHDAWTSLTWLLPCDKHTVFQAHTPQKCEEHTVPGSSKIAASWSRSKLSSTSSPLREEHRVGPSLPWEEGEEPIKESYAGHIPIRSWQQDGFHGEASMFYWFFPAINPKVKDPPLIIWLQGGPGSSSMIGLFFENGPIRVTENMKLARKDVSWADEYSMLFLDQPVGTGYSYVTRVQDGDDTEVTDSETLRQLESKLATELEQDQAREQDLFSSQGKKDFNTKSAFVRNEKIKNGANMYTMGYVKDERGVAADLMVFLEQFYERFPEQRKADLYITGESYAGKYVPVLAHALMEYNKNIENSGAHAQENKKINLKGIALGNSLTDPISQVQIHADHGYYLGLLTRKQANHMMTLQVQSVSEAHRGRFVSSNRFRVNVFDYFRNSTGGLNWYDIRKGGIPNDWSRMEKFMNLDNVKEALNVFGPRSSFLKDQGASPEEIERIEEGRARTKYFKDPLVIKTMAGDIMKSAAWMVSDLLEYRIKVVAYQGIFDYRDAVAGSNVWIEDLDWSGKEAYLNAERELWTIQGQLVGYVTRVPRLTKVALLGAGHLAPMDQATTSLTMIRSLIEDVELACTNFDGLHKERAHII
ncbi:hypothetical protein BGW38_003836 [Lunasporangiospora selenospora]|uniref:Carboxypeptidase n=1 Tax=Lunasporangiospora selenospora TaxID=979761 RepID=A0A9P6KCK3_9FUNG|nr:hypothetical protein BGW38_003836 [Lunasporangiospora selenospora]